MLTKRFLYSNEGILTLNEFSPKALRNYMLTAYCNNLYGKKKAIYEDQGTQSINKKVRKHY